MDVNAAFVELGLDRHASLEAAKIAYRQRAMLLHPDRNRSANAEAQMSALNVAYECVKKCITEERIRKITNQPGVHSTWNGFKAPHPTNKPKQQHKNVVSVNLNEAAFGCTKRIQTVSTATCQSCTGVGHLPTTNSDGVCAKCIGKGIYSQRGRDGVRGHVVTCDECNGSGTVKHTCPSCHGSGKGPSKTHSIDIVVPPGVKHGMTITANRSDGMTPGSVIKVIVSIEDHPLFKIKGDELTVHVPINIWKWYLGGKVTIPTLSGVVDISFPSMAETVAIKHEGWPVFNDDTARGDLKVILDVEFPDKFSKKEMELLERLNATTDVPVIDSWKKSIELWTNSNGDQRFGL